MKVLVDCRSVRPGKSGGIENFAYTVIKGISGFVKEVVVDVCRPDLSLYKSYVGEHENVRFVSDPLQGFFVSLNDGPRLGKLSATFFALFTRVLGFRPFTRRHSWAKSHRADVVFYPYHIAEVQHQHIPMVTTVHAILPGYDDKKMARISRHMEAASAIVTSWPQPYKELSQRYPFSKERLFLIPYTAKQNVESSENYDTSRLGIRGDYYLYPAILSPRKNHINLIKAYGHLRQQGKTAPMVVCTGGGNQELEENLRREAQVRKVEEKFLFLGYVSKEAMTALYSNCRAAISATLWEAGISVIQEAGMCGKPIICSNIEPARDHAKLLDMEVCFFDPNDPEHIARKIVEFENEIDRFRESSIGASTIIRLIDEKYTGRCYVDVFRYAAGLAEKPSWAPFMRPFP